MFLILAILTGVRWNRKVVLISVSLRTKDVERFKKKYLLAICIPPSEKPLFCSTAHILIGVLVTWCLVFESLIYSGDRPSVRWVTGKDFPAPSVASSAA